MRRFPLFLPLLALAAAAHAQYGANLVVNGGAEDGPTGNGGLVSSIPGWTAFDYGGTFAGAKATVVRYGAGAVFPTATSPGPNDRGLSFFSGGPEEKSDALYQSIDLSWAGADIDAAQVKIQLSAYLGGAGYPYEPADAEIRLYDAAGNILAAPGISSNDHPGPSLYSYGVNYRPPVGARRAEVWMYFYDFAIPGLTGWNGTNDAYIDNISVVVTKPVPEPASMLALAGGVAALLRRKRAR